MDAKAPWDQRGNEPAEAYARFLVYLSLGPGRGVPEAVRIGMTEKAGKGGKRRAPPRSAESGRNGQWERDCRDFDWVSRASRYDAYMLSHEMPAIASAMMKGIMGFAQRYIQQVSSNSNRLNPQSFSELLEGVKFLGSFFPADTLDYLLHPDELEHGSEDASAPDLERN